MKYAIIAALAFVTSAHAGPLENAQTRYIACGMVSYDVGRDHGLGRIEAINAMFDKCKRYGLAIEKTYGKAALNEAGTFVEKWAYKDVDPLK